MKAPLNFCKTIHGDNHENATTKAIVPKEKYKLVSIKNCLEDFIREKYWWKMNEMKTDLEVDDILNG